MRISLEACRINAKLTQEELAKILGTKADNVSGWEQGSKEPSLSQLRKISELSGIPIDYIYIPEA